MPHYVSETGTVKNAYINQGCVIEGHVESSVLFTNVHIGEEAEVSEGRFDAKMWKLVLVQKFIVQL